MLNTYKSSDPLITILLNIMRVLQFKQPPYAMEIKPGPMNMCSLYKEDVPEYLRDGDFCRSLDFGSEESDEISVPDSCFKRDSSVASINDLEHILSTLRFWVVHELPIAVYEFCLQKRWPEIAHVVTAFDSQLHQLQTLRKIMKSSPKDRIRFAMEGKSLHVVKWLREQGCLWTPPVCRVAAQVGWLAGLKYAHEQGCPWMSDTCSAAALGGHLDCLVYAHEQGCKWDNVTCANAAANGHLHCLKYARSKDCPWDVETAIAAAKNNRLECLTYAIENKCEWTENVALGAVEKGHLDCLRYCLAPDMTGMSLTNLYTAAARHGQLHCLEYLHCMYNHVDQDAYRSIPVINAAAKGNHWDCVSFLHTIGYNWNKTTASEAAQNGHLELLQKLHDNGCPWDKDTPVFSAKYGHIECLKYAYENDCQYSASAYDEALRNGHTKCVEFLQSGAWSSYMLGDSDSDSGREW